MNSLAAQWESSPESIVQIDNLSRCFDRKSALENVSLRIPRGCVFGLAGANGAGKTTLLRHILGLFQSQAGSVRVFGLDPVQHPAAVLGRIGFLSEDRDLPMWMRLDQVIRYHSSFYPRWDRVLAQSLVDKLHLPLTVKVKHLSRGELAKAGLLLALAHRPDLLILDEPSSGLDPVVRREMLETIVRATAEEGRTVLFSSHLLDEIERVADVVGLMNGGRLVLHQPMAELLENHRLVTVADVPAQAISHLPGVRQVMDSGREKVVLLETALLPGFLADLAKANGRVLQNDPASLEDIFIAYAGKPLPVSP